jgi:predicted nuclease of restriction endonuclease-like (RecB) superfamily
MSTRKFGYSMFNPNVQKKTLMILPWGSTFIALLNLTTHHSEAFQVDDLDFHHISED